MSDRSFDILIIENGPSLSSQIEKMAEKKLLINVVPFTAIHTRSCKSEESFYSNSARHLDLIVIDSTGQVENMNQKPPSLMDIMHEADSRWPDCRFIIVTPPDDPRLNNKPSRFIFTTLTEDASPILPVWKHIQKIMNEEFIRRYLPEYRLIG